jgi:putative heme-binding domain-containing protein
MKQSLFACLMVAVLAPVSAARPPAAPSTSQTKLPPGVTVPAGFDVTVFARPPEVNYPTCLAVTPRGQLFVGIDEQGSLGQEKNRGRVVRCVDRDGDGVADQITTFVKLEHPRGLLWDDAIGALYVLHPGNLTRHFDTDADGVADRADTLVTGLWNERMTNERGADHTTNGIRLGIDGWIYIAVGDFGAFDAAGADGARLTLRGGGIVRVRTDGSGLEIFARGTRNIYDVAIDPLMNIFTRDNTNDGDGWNDRLTCSVPTAFHGYPTHYKRFADETVGCLIDFGGGSPCGSLFVDEPGLPEGLGRALYTVEWGRNVIDRHPLSSAGAGFKATTEKLMDLPRGTDIDIDGASRLYVSSWAGGGFRYTDENVGYILRMKPRGYQAPPFPNLREANDGALIAHLSSPSGVLRQAAQREILRRGDSPALAEGLAKLTTSDAPLSTRVAAVFTLRLLRGDRADGTIVALATHDDLREFALRALADRRDNPVVSVRPHVEALRDPDPRVRLVAAWGVGRLKRVYAAGDVLRLTADADPLVAHVAVNSLVTLKAIDDCLAAVAGADAKQATGALRALQQMHEEPVVHGLTAALAEVREPQRRTLILRALCRLYWREAKWDGSWWSTRPDTSGPYYNSVAWSATPRIAALIRSALESEQPQVVRALLIDCAAHKIDLPEVQERLVGMALTDSSLCDAMLDALAGRKELSKQEIDALKQVTTAGSIAAATRARAIRALTETGSAPEAIEAAVAALAPVATAENPDADLAAALDTFMRSPQVAGAIPVLSRVAAGGSPGQREVALSAVLSLADSKLAKPNRRKQAEAAIAEAWDDPAAVAPMLRAVGRAKSARFADRVRGYLKDPDAAVAGAAGYAARMLDIGEPDTAPGETIASLGYDRAIETVLKLDGDAVRGRELFTRQGCVACHTVSPAETLKGPFLGGIASRYKRSELLESILEPGAKIAQGFETQWFKRKHNVVEGFVTRESGDEIEIRDLTGTVTILNKGLLTSRGKRDTSMMPTGLADKLSPQDLASLISYLESLKS